MLTVTFKGVWAGWKDAPLSELGDYLDSQAYALGQAFLKSNTKFDFIYASDLLRANATGRAVLDAHAPPKPPFTSDSRLREQHFGIAEGQPWVIETPPNKSLEQLFEEGIFPVLKGRDARFPDGESLNDLARRTEKAIADCVVAHLTGGDLHIAIASHGLCISELIAALLRLDPDSRRDISYAGLLNTAWTRVVVSVKDESYTGSIDASNIPPLNVRVTDVKNSDHLAALKKDDPVVSENSTQAEARAFFGGKTLS
ncbi:phosphoglycerate mutase [Mycena rebaudengoi]|nr:phosphoglycerate mutase [Mycena rebaudengoi]